MPLREQIPEAVKRAARELARPAAMHQIRFVDTSPFPITTAPAVRR